MFIIISIIPVIQLQVLLITNEISIHYFMSVCSGQALALAHFSFLDFFRKNFRRKERHR